MTSEELQKVLTDSGVRRTEAAGLFRVAPTTLDRWLKGEVKPKQPMTYEIACKMANILAEAAEKGYLPVKDAVGKARLHQIRQAIRQVASDRA
jgi:transcriptional regulator with XRE-family HTH domain